MEVLPDEVLRTADIIFKWLCISARNKPFLDRDRNGFDFMTVIM